MSSKRFWWIRGRESTRVCIRGNEREVQYCGNEWRSSRKSFIIFQSLSSCIGLYAVEYFNFWDKLWIFEYRSFLNDLNHAVIVHSNTDKFVLSHFGNAIIRSEEIKLAVESGSLFNIFIHGWFYSHYFYHSDWLHRKGKFHLKNSGVWNWGRHKIFRGDSGILAY